MKVCERIGDSTIHIKGMEFYAYHGVLEEERKLGQKFIVDIDIAPAKWIAGTDNINDTISYAEVYTVVKECVEQEKFQLLESLAETISSRVLEKFHCNKIRIEVHKPNAPIPGIFSDVSIEIFRGSRA